MMFTQHNFIGICRANMVKHTHSCTFAALLYADLKVQAVSKVYPVSELYLDEVAVGAPCWPEMAGFWSATTEESCCVHGAT